MSKYEQLIIRHETARSLVSKLKLKRLQLIKECENIDVIDNPNGGWGTVEVGKLCLTSVFDELMNTIEENYGEGYSYHEILENMHAEERCCDNCRDSYLIKIGPLADAKKEFGNAKRAIAYAGKKLINKGVIK